MLKSDDETILLLLSYRMFWCLLVHLSDQVNKNHEMRREEAGAL